MVSCNKKDIPASIVSVIYPSQIATFIQKEGIIHADRMEATPFIWNDGRMLLMVSARTVGKIEIYDGENLVTSIESNLSFGSAIMNEGTLYIFGTTPDYKNNNGSEVNMISTNDLINWTAPIVVLNKNPNMTYFNTSVDKLPDGSFIMAAETCEPNTVCFNSRFYKSTDLVNWVEVGSIFSKNSYAACPTIRYVSGYYYLFYLIVEQNGAQLKFSTYIARSLDLVNWEYGKMLVLGPEGDEGINASDMDLIEHQGKVYINYADGDQGAVSDIRLATYEGSLNDFVQKFF